METFSTVIKNNTDQSIQIRSPKNYVGAFLTVSPKSSRTVRFNDEAYFLAPYEKVTYKKSGRVDCVKRKGYEPPAERFPSTLFLNSGGGPLECIVLDRSDTIQLPRGIPIRHNAMPLFSFYSEFSEVEILEPKMIPKPMVMNPGTIKYEKHPNFKLVKRSPADMKRLKEMREAAYLRSKGFRPE